LQLQLVASKMRDIIKGQLHGWNFGAVEQISNMCLSEVS
jgi:hypothetical protein